MNDLHEQLTHFKTVSGDVISNQCLSRLVREERAFDESHARMSNFVCHSLSNAFNRNSKNDKFNDHIITQGQKTTAYRLKTHQRIILR